MLGALSAAPADLGQMLLVASLMQMRLPHRMGRRWEKKPQVQWGVAMGGWVVLMRLIVVVVATMVAVEVVERSLVLVAGEADSAALERAMAPRRRRRVLVM